jgi:ElaB/YqjD/DUF883 family membrane-anchored ribosome-binding protein
MEVAFSFRELEGPSPDRRNFYNRGWRTRINMNKHSEPNDATVPAPAQKGAVSAAATDLANETMTAARERLSAAMEKGEELVAGLRGAAAERARSADLAIREHPYRTLAIALGVGALVGFLLARSRERNTASGGC